MKDRNLTLFMDIINEATIEFDTASGDKLPDDHPLNTCFEGEDGKSLLFVGIKSGKEFTEYVNVLLNAGVPPCLFNEELQTYPLHYASKERNLEAMKHIIRCGANINLVLGNGRTALHICAERRRRADLEELPVAIMTSAGVVHK